MIPNINRIHGGHGEVFMVGVRRSKFSSAGERGAAICMRGTENSGFDVEVPEKLS